MSNTDTSTTEVHEAEPITEFTPGERVQAPPKPPTKTELKNLANFEAVANTLAAAEHKAKSASGDASAARAERSTVAVDTIKAAVKGKIEGATVRSTLLGAGVLKGTVSKIVTILDAIASEQLTLADVKSLNGAYSLINAARKAGDAAKAGGVTGGATGPGASAPAVATTPEQAAEIIYATIRNAGSDDAILSAAAEWITNITDGITAITSAIGSSAE